MSLRRLSASAIARRLLVVGVYERRGDLSPAELARRLGCVVAGEDLHRAAVHDDRPVLRIALEAPLDRLEVAAAGVARGVPQPLERLREVCESRGDHARRPSVGVVELSPANGYF